MGLFTIGFPRSVGRRAVALAGGVNEMTRLAASNEWLLQHVEYLFCQANGLSTTPPEPDNPWAEPATLMPAPTSSDASTQSAGAVPSPVAYSANSAGVGGTNVLTRYDHAVLLRSQQDGWQEREQDARSPPQALLPRDFLVRQPRRWRKDQLRRGVTGLPGA